MVASSASAELEDEFDETYAKAFCGHTAELSLENRREGSKGSSDLKEELF
jgi:hypothetical protein